MALGLGLTPVDFNTWSLRDLDAMNSVMRRQRGGAVDEPADDQAFEAEQREARAEWDSMQQGNVT